MLKDLAKSALIKRSVTKYNKTVNAKSSAYDKWQKAIEKEPVVKADAPVIMETLETGEVVPHKKPEPKVKVIAYSKVWEVSDMKGDENTIYIFASSRGKLTKRAQEVIQQYFIAHPEHNVVYGDEDEMGNGGKYIHPYFKPDWSPDSYLNAFYIGSFFACRSETMHAAATEYDNAVRMLGGVSNKKNSPEQVGLEASLLSADVLFCMLAIHERAFAKRTGMELPIGHIREVLFHRSAEQEVFYGRSFHNSRHMLLKPATVSIIIPSKDHPEILQQCLNSIIETTGDENIKYEIVIIDNGSSAANRVKYGVYCSRAPRKNGLTNINYIYKLQEFNFSAMCNQGVRNSTGEYLLFLNDDIEAKKEGWLREMLSQAQLGHVGAVGAKLIYPDTDLIQHAGIANVRRGPVHKLQKMHDGKNHYFGYNRGVHNNIGVTAACLLISRKKYNDIGGFPEELKVAFNDVDFCYSVIEAGYYNVCCNHIYLYHHESLTRGIDNLDPKKMERLGREGDTLMRRHSHLYNFDPFYSPHLTEDETISAIIPKEDYTPVEDIPYSRISVHEKGIKGAREDQCLRIGCEYNGTLDNWLYGVTAEGNDEGYYLKGYSFVIGSDNAIFEKQLLLRLVERHEDGAGPADRKVYAVPFYTWYRPDIRIRLQDQVNVDLTGYKVKIRKGDLEPGYYQIGMLAVDKTSRLKLVNWVPNILNVKE
ncbi:Glycosyltransferase, GT2 family [Butyrivibrio sp. Su6]|uniref:glycosyltransferase family 2 protein n=1 Tax=Butyrivibrio sp. Su6 TaxID=1520810 RepID=UPI00089E4760|nr:glycosyltransferase [Butyrivibrio sp. Su6]SEG46892.1 Glycosyltransferase, GT2 family [Butyrivibrio sp. Su6]